MSKQTYGLFTTIRNTNSSRWCISMAMAKILLHKMHSPTGGIDCTSSQLVNILPRIIIQMTAADTNHPSLQINNGNQTPKYSCELLVNKVHFCHLRLSLLAIPSLQPEFEFRGIPNKLMGINMPRATLKLPTCVCRLCVPELHHVKFHTNSSGWPDVLVNKP